MPFLLLLGRRSVNANIGYNGGRDADRHAIDTMLTTLTDAVINLFVNCKSAWMGLPDLEVHHVYS